MKLGADREERGGRYDQDTSYEIVKELVKIFC